LKRRRISVVAPEPVRPRMAGMGIRAFEIARALCEEFDVRLLVPGDPAEAPPAPGLEIRAALPGTEEFARLARHSDGALVSGHAAGAFFAAAPEVPVAVDWYDPFLVENFRYGRTLGPEVEARDREAWTLALLRGDFFLCASEEQRLFYAGMLVQGGRWDAERFLSDPAGRSLIAVVPFGVRAPAEARPDAVRRAVGAEPGDPVLLFGGLYDWNDPEAVLESWDELTAAHPGLRLIFCENPNPATTPQSAFERARTAARDRGWLAKSVFFLPWTPYDRRGNLYAASTLAVCACRSGLEADLSFRTRLLDAAAAGLASVSLHGGGLARRLEEAGAGVAAASPRELIEAIGRYLAEPAGRREAGERARRFAEDSSWERVIRPLSEFFRKGRVSRRLAFPTGRPGSLRARLRSWSRR
jgi:glycosyltransferase involved in cell wall biosynthesis